MKPRPPHLRKTVKWAGAAVTVLLVTVWIGSMCFTVGWTSQSGRTGKLWCGTLLLGHSYWSEGSPLSDPGFQATGPYVFNPMWWIWFDHRPPRRSWALAIPLWMFLVPSGVLPAAAWRLDHLARRRARLNLCPKCNYDRTGLALAAACPECGSQPAEPATRA